MISIIDDRLEDDYMSLTIMGYETAQETFGFQEDRIDGVYVVTVGGLMCAKYLYDGHLCVISMKVDKVGLGFSMLRALFSYIHTKGQDYIYVRGIDQRVKTDHFLADTICDNMDQLRACLEVPVEKLNIAIIDWKWAHYDIDLDTYQELIDSVEEYLYRYSSNDRYGWAMDRASEEAATRAHSWLSGYRKNIYTDEDLTRNPHIKSDLNLNSDDDIETFIQGLEDDSKWVRMKETRRWWEYPAPRPESGTHVGIFMYTSDKQLVASISASYIDASTSKVDFVNTRLDYRNKGLCKIMFSTLAQYLSSTGRTTQLTLTNAAGVAGCKCYTEGALHGGFASRTVPATCGIAKIKLPFTTIPTTKSSLEAIQEMGSRGHSHVVPTYRSKVLDMHDPLILLTGHPWKQYQQPDKKRRQKTTDPGKDF